MKIQRPKHRLKNKLFNLVNKYISGNQHENQLTPLGSEIYLEALAGELNEPFSFSGTVQRLERLSHDIALVAMEIE